MSDAPAVQRWTTPEVEAGEASFNSTRGERGLSLRDLERIQKQAYEEAFAQGVEDGRAAGRQEAAAQMKDQVDLLNAIVGQLAAPFATLDRALEEQTAHLAMSVVRRLFRRELKMDPGAIVGVVREGLEALPVSANNVRVLLHPDDAELVDRALTDTDGERAWRIIEDPLLSRGGCRIETETSRIDARVEARIDAVVNALLGDERATERETE
ncbi:MAG: flagellar assembly protein FliH [Pseudomonadota bacterium]